MGIVDLADPTLILPEVSPRPPMEPAPAQSGVVEVTEPLPIPGVDPPTERARPTGPARIAGAGDEPGREGHRKAEVSDELPTLAYMPRLRLDGASIRSSDSPCLANNDCGADPPSRSRLTPPPPVENSLVICRVRMTIRLLCSPR